MMNINRRFDFTKFKSTLKRKIVPTLGLIFASFVLFFFALAGLGPLLRQYAPDQEKITEESTVLAEQFAETISSDTPDIAVSLETPHRGNAQVGAWAALSVASMLNFTPANYDEHVRGMTSYADERGRTDFHSFVINGNILETLGSNNLQLRDNVEDTPLIINTGVLEGRYRWLFEMPVLLTFLPVGAKSYSDSDHLSQHVLVTTQVGRVAYGTNDDELMIESFSVRKNPAYKD